VADVWRECAVADGRQSASGFLVGELRQARAAAGLSQEDLGRAINYSSSLVSAVENGQRPPSSDYVVAVDRALSTGGLFERLLSGLVSLDRAPVWLRDWILFEREATLLRWSEPSLVPGLLQTEAYASAVLERNGLLSKAEIEESVASRMERQAILTRPTPPTFIASSTKGRCAAPSAAPTSWRSNASTCSPAPDVPTFRCTSCRPRPVLMPVWRAVSSSPRAATSKPHTWTIRCALRSSIAVTPLIS
jgi:transcriptional regulator with XRE-family HTH domain